MVNGNEEEQHSSFFSLVLHTRQGENNDEEAMHELKYPGGHAIEKKILINNRRKCIEKTRTWLRIFFIDFLKKKKYFLLKTQKSAQCRAEREREIRPAGIHDCTGRREES